ncbi:hypothetical protein ACHWQZ_G003586 [Mnemiopsis leidyi]
MSPNLGMGSSLKHKFESSMYSGRLEISALSLRTIPKEIDDFDITDVMTIDVSRNKFTEIPEEVLRCADAEELNCYHNMIRTICELNCMRFLCKLNLCRNQLTAIPSHLCSLPLEELYLANNKIHTLPAEIGNLKSLIDFDLSCNMLSSIPVEFGQLTSLKDLNVRHNFITHIPSELTETSLVRLDLSYNRIAIIPPSYRFLKDLKHLDISNNPLVCPPAQYAERGRVHIFKLLEILVWQQEQKELLEYEKTFRRKKEEERAKLNYANPRSTTNSNNFINELLVSWDAQATASMLEDPFFKKELEKDKTYREKYGIKDDYMKRSLQVAQGRSINTINRTSGKAIAKQLAATPDVHTKDPLEDIPRSKSSPSVEKKEKKSKRDSKSSKSPKSDKTSSKSPKSDKSMDSPSDKKSVKSPRVTTTKKEEEEALALLEDVFMDRAKENTFERSEEELPKKKLSEGKRAVSFSEQKAEVIPPVPSTSPPQSSDEEEPATLEHSFTMNREEGKIAQTAYQQEFVKNMVAKYLNISIKDAEESLKDGVILCQLLNEMKKNAVRKIMMPQGEEKLSTMKSTVNLNSFLRFVQINIGKDNCCSISDIQQGELSAIHDTLKRLGEKFPYQSDA